MVWLNPDGYYSVCEEDLATCHLRSVMNFMCSGHSQSAIAQLAPSVARGKLLPLLSAVPAAGVNS